MMVVCTMPLSAHTKRKKEFSGAHSVFGLDIVNTGRQEGSPFQQAVRWTASTFLRRNIAPSTDRYPHRKGKREVRESNQTAGVGMTWGGFMSPAENEQRPGAPCDAVSNRCETASDSGGILRGTWRWGQHPPLHRYLASGQVAPDQLGLHGNGVRTCTGGRHQHGRQAGRSCRAFLTLISPS